MKKNKAENLTMNEWINLHSAASGALLNPGTLTQWEPWIIHVRFKILKQCETLIQGARAFFGTFSIFSHRDKHKNTWTQILKLRKKAEFLSRFRFRHKQGGRNCRTRHICWRTQKDLPHIWAHTEFLSIFLPITILINIKILLLLNLGI